MFSPSFFDFGFVSDTNVLLAELINRQGGYGAIPEDQDFIIQNEVLNDRSQFKAMQCTRRSGKSTTEVIDHINKCTEFPESKSLYMALTLDSASEICWDIFKEYNDKHSLGLKFNQSKKIVFYPNGSRTRLFGLDSNEKQITRVLGQKVRKVSIDECGSMTRNMTKIILQMILPTLADLAPNSWLTLLGTSENIPNTFFEAVTSGRENSLPWKVYKWTAFDNPYMKKQWGELIKQMTDSNPDVVHASWFRTHYLNEWVSDDDLVIIPHTKMQFVDALPRSSDWIHILGVDLGFNDASSFVVVSYSFTQKSAYVSEVYKQSGLDFTEVAETIDNLKSRFTFSRIVVDGANKQGIEHMKRRLNLPELETAEKQGKPVYLKLLRDDVVTGKLKFVMPQCEPLKLEWSHLQWKDQKKLLEDPRCENHGSDAALYAWRETHAYLAELPQDTPKPSDETYGDYLEQKEMEKTYENEESFAFGTTETDSDW